MRRRGQYGNVFQKGRSKSDSWLPEVPAYLQFWRDIPGQAESRREKLALGICPTRTIAERKANIVKGVVASAINDSGEEVFPRKWNDEYIDAPVIGSQRQPSTTTDSLTAIIDRATGHYQNAVLATRRLRAA